jgi:hypothetical protein
MIVPKMSWDELRREFFEDIRIVQARNSNQSRIFQQKMVKQKQQHSLFTEPYISPHRNQWLCFHDVSISNKECFYTQCCLYYDHIGLKTLSVVNVKEPDQQAIIRLNSHFYNRYNERMELRLLKPEQIVKHFYRNNFRRHHPIDNLPTEEDGHLRIFMTSESGVMLGYRYLEKELVEMKTFITYDMLKGDQVDTVKFLRDYYEPNLTLDNYE